MQTEHQIPDDTKTRILNVAEKLFAEQGFDATSLRMITTLANVNLASVNYHFQSKEALHEAVYSRRVGPINHRRLELLSAAEAGPEPLEVAAILDALFRPVFESCETVSHMPRLVIRLLYLDASESSTRTFETLFRPILQRFQSAFRRALPHLSEQELASRLQFVLGAFAHAMVSSRSMQLMTGGRIEPSLDKTLHRLTQFTAAGLSAPSHEEKACAS